METKFNYSKLEPIKHIICDSNVWYYLADGTFEKPENNKLIATSLSIMEIASSETLIPNLKRFQGIIEAIKKFSGPIIPLNPFDFVLVNHDPKFPVDLEPLKKTLTAFSEVLCREFPEDVEIDEDIITEIKMHCNNTRESTIDFAQFATENLVVIRKNINKGKGKKEHIKIETHELIKEMLVSILDDYCDKIGYKIDFINFKWENLEFFIAVTENYFKKLEITKNMKVKPNDAVDWLNMMYVLPGNKYLTFETSWKNIILQDNRTKQYFFQPN